MDKSKEKKVERLKKWELVQWDQRWFAVGVELVKGKFNVLIESGSRDMVRAYMRQLAGWEDKEERMTFYDVHRMTGKQQDKWMF